jgi:dTDP-4-dehydrorhamnose 3,5-epimerase
MKFTPLAIPEVILLEPDVHIDNRGYFYERFNQNDFEQIVKKKNNFVQDNHSQSKKNVLRGLHYQLSPSAQGKLVTVVQGEVFDVAVDIRKSSVTFGKWVSAVLSAENKKQLWVPVGFAHGFITLSEISEMIYKTTDYYSPKHERCIIWNDPTINISWPINIKPILSEKDLSGNLLNNAELI